MKDSTKGAVKGNIIKYCLHLLEINYLNHVDFYVKIVYNKEDGLLTGIAKEQVLTSGYAGEDLDSYFFTYTIEPEYVTEEEMQNIKVTIKNIKIKVKMQKKYTHLQILMRVS